MAELISQPSDTVVPLDAAAKTRSMLSSAKTALGIAPSQDTLKQAFNNKNPTSLSSWNEQGASVNGKVKRLLADPRYQKLSPEAQDRVRGKIYDQYVAPIYKNAGKQIPDRNTWLAETHRDRALDYSTYGDTPMQEKVADFAMGIWHEANEMSVFGAKVTKENFLRNYGLGVLFGLPPIAGHRDFTSKPAQALRNATDNVFDKWQRSAQQNVNDTDYWFATHPRSGFFGGAARWTGEQVASLPLYGALEGVGIGATLTEKLGVTAGGKAVSRAINGGFVGLAGSMVEHGRTTPTSEDVKSGVGFAVLGAAGGAIFDKAGEWLARAKAGDKTLKVANDAAIKKWSAEQLAQGGDPLSQASIHAASEELRGHTTGIEPPPATTGVTPPPVRIAPEVRKVRDPDLHALIEGDKMSLQSLALRHYGMNYEKLPKEFQDKVDTLRLQRMEEAKYEMPIHKPELNKVEIQQSLAEQAKASPSLARRMEQYKQLFGTDVAEAVNEHQVDAIAKQTGVKNPDAAAKKLIKSDTNRTIKSRLGPKPPESKRISPAKFASHKVETAAFFKNPVRSVGADINYRNLDTKGLINILRAGDKDFIKFENPFHRMLYHWDNRVNLPTELRNTLRSELKRHLKTKFPEQPNLVVDLDKYAERAHLHLQMLAQSGRLTSDKNMFRSTNLFGAPTQWQTALNTEIDQEEIVLLRKNLKMHPDALSTVDAFLEILQSNRAEGLITPNQWKDYNRAIEMLLGGEPRKAKVYNKVLEETYATVPR